MVSILNRDHYERNLLDRLDELGRKLAALEHTELSGVAGPEGPTGPTGPTGPQGPQGDMVAAGSYTITGLFTFDRDPGAPFAVTATSAMVANLDADKVDGIDLPGTIASVLSDHNKAAHDALGIDADTLDTYHASSFPRKAEVATITAAWQHSAYIGIGTAPSYPLHITSNSGAPYYASIFLTGSLVSYAAAGNSPGFNTYSGSVWAGFYYNSVDPGLRVYVAGSAAAGLRIMNTTTGAYFMMDKDGLVGLNKAPSYKLDIDLATEDFAIEDAGSAAATEQDWLQVRVGGNVGYIRVFAAK